MTANSVKLDYDQARNIVFTEDEYQIATEADVDDFIDRNQKFLEKIGHKVYIISKIDGLHIGPAVAEYYGQRVRAVFDGYLLGFARYGHDATARMMVRTSSHRAKLVSNIYDTKEQAIEAIEKMKTDQPGQ
jgi:hypothetical protein